jgi:hypothetical protein
MSSITVATLIVNAVKEASSSREAVSSIAVFWKAAQQHLL